MSPKARAYNLSVLVSGSNLVVDGEELFRAAVVRILSQQGHRVAVAHTGAEAWESSRRESPDVVLVNLRLPDMELSAFVATLRESSPEQELILVADGELAETASLARRLGVSDVLLKPAEGATLTLAVDRCLERASLRHERGRLLNENLEFAREHSLQQRCLEFLTHPDLEWLQERVLGELASVCDAQSAALFVVDDRGELHLRAYRGLLDKRFLPEQLTLEGGFAVRVLAGTPWVTGDGKSRMMFVPLVTGGEVLGLCQLSDPLTGEFHQDHSRGSKTLADFAAVALRNARKFLALQRLGLKDRETGAYNLSYFTDYASKEIYTARRYSRTFSLLTFSVDNLPQVKVRLGAKEAARATRGIIRAFSKILRDSDIVAKASDQEFYLLLPETDFFGAMIFARRAAAALREDADVMDVEARLPLAVTGGAASFPKDGEDFDELVHRCRRRMDEGRSSLHRKLMLEPLDFWEQVEVLLGNAQSPKLPTDERAEPSRRGKVSEDLFQQLQEEIARELLRDPLGRGLIYVGGPAISMDLPLASELETAPVDIASRVYLLGRRGDMDSHPSLTPVFIEADERLNRHEFILWLGEASAYALIQRRGKGAVWGFHSSDTAVVDGLITKLQAAYDLQPY